MIAKYIKITFLLVFVSLNAQSQLSTTFNLYFVNPVIINPASSVNDSGYTAYSNYRHQWMGLSINVSVYKNGMLTNNEFNVGYAYKLAFSENHNLAFGISYGMYRLGINRAAYPDEVANDPAVNGTSFDQTFFKTGFGLSYQVKGIQFDFALPELYDQNKNTYFSSIYSFVSYNLKLKEKWLIKPIIGYRNYYNSASQYDYGLMAMWQQKFWIHTGYRTLNGMIFSVGVNLNKIGFAYSYEVASSVMSHVSSGSNEISLLYYFRKSKPQNRENITPEIMPTTSFSYSSK